jgi:hypothetical protein
MALGPLAVERLVEAKETTMTISPVSAAVAGALISGVAMYAVGPRAERVDAFTTPATAYVQTVDGQIVPVTPAAQPGYVSSLAPAPAMIPVAQAPVTPTRTVYRTAAPAQERVVVQRERSGRSWTKTAMVIGGSAGAGAGVGGLVGGKKGALIGAALGGGAASIYEASKR